MEFSTPCTGSPCKKRYSVCCEYNIKDSEQVGLQQPLFSSDFCYVVGSASFFDRRGKEMIIKADTQKKPPKNYCPFWNNNLCRDERADTSLPSMRNKTKACATPNIPVQLVGGNWIKNSHSEVKIVPLPVFVALNQKLRAIWQNFRKYFSPLRQYFKAATQSSRGYQEDTNNETFEILFQGLQKKTGLDVIYGKAEFQL